jgi:hypothetical protein
MVWEVVVSQLSRCIVSVVKVYCQRYEGVSSALLGIVVSVVKEREKGERERRSNECLEKERV